MDVHISLVGRQGLGSEIYRQLRAAIVDGHLSPGDALPPTRELAQRLGVSRSTVTGVYDQLIGEGYAVARTGSGTFVSAEAVHARPSTAAREAALRPRPFWESQPLPPDLMRAAEFDFRPGTPDAPRFPHATWRRLLAREFRPAALGRGGYGEPAGHAGLREAIARYFSVSRGLRADAADIVVTSGTQQAVDLVARVLLAPGDGVAVEDPGYGPTRRVLAAQGLRVACVPVDDEGLVVDAIPRGTRLVLVCPSHQFPLGVSMSLRRRVALLDWAARHQAAIVEDDYDSEFRFGGRPIEPVQLLDAHGRVIYVGSFSKTVLPSLRLGFVVVPPSLQRAVVTAKYLSDWHSPLALQGAMARFIAEGHFARHVRRMRSVYEARHRRIVERVARTMADTFELVPSSVGLHVAALARGRSVADVARALRHAQQDGVECYPLAMFSAADSPRAGVLLGYGSIAEDRIDEGLARLHAAFAQA